MLVCDSPNITQSRTNNATFCQNLQTDIYQARSNLDLRRELFVNPITARIFSEIQELARYRHGCCFASQAEIARLSGVSRKTVNRHLKIIGQTSHKGRFVIRKHLRNRKDKGRDSNAYEVLNIYTGHYHPATQWILDRTANERSKRGGLRRENSQVNGVPPPGTLSPTNKELVLKDSINRSSKRKEFNQQCAQAREEVEVKKVIPTCEVLPLVGWKENGKKEVKAMVNVSPANDENFEKKHEIEPFAGPSYLKHFEKKPTDIICRDETVILQTCGLSNVQIQRVLGAAARTKASLERIYDVIQIAFDYKDKILSLSSFLINAFVKNHKPNLPRIKGLPPIGPKFSPAEKRNVEHLLNHWIDGYSIQRGIYKESVGFLLMKGDAFCSKRSRFFSWDSPICRRALLELMAALYGRILDVCERNGYCRDEFGNKKVFAPPCAMVQLLLEKTAKPDFAEISTKYDLIEVENPPEAEGWI